MRFGILCLSLLLALFASPGVDAARRAEEGSASDWMRRMSAALIPATTARARVTLEVANGPLAGSRMHMKVSRRADASQKRTLIEVTAPESLRGTVYEVVDRGGASVERWEYLPSVRRLRLTSGIEGTDAFLGTEFRYEDLELAAPLQRERGRVERVREEERELVRVTSDGYHDYGRVVTFIDPRSELPVRIDFYDRSGVLSKVQEFDQIERIQGRSVPTVVVMRDLRTGSTSTLSFGGVEFDVEVPRQISEMRAVRLSQGMPPPRTD